MGELSLLITFDKNANVDWDGAFNLIVDICPDSRTGKTRKTTFFIFTQTGKIVKVHSTYRPDGVNCDFPEPEP